MSTKPRGSCADKGQHLELAPPPVSQQGFQELSPCAPRDHSDVGQEGYAMSSEWLRAVPGRSLLPPMATFHVTRSISQLS